ncbi:Zinc finger MYM-type protein 1 [Amphibalanus amphitrite]|uniref:ATP-dependent DNA helicase n=1 Tax=Amphibalanus amphitrite TaxID=1232801 RepID=A0A6A4W4Z0_AMPAM|nr:Zinc finger MYM-type protein 1 [Amphibalanus amphitrite]
MGLATSFPETYRLLYLILTIKPTTVTEERSFSALRRLKTFLRSTIGQDRLSHLSTINIQSELVVSLERSGELAERVIEKFAQLKERRIDLLFNDETLTETGRLANNGVCRHLQSLARVTVLGPLPRPSAAAGGKELHDFGLPGFTPKQRDHAAELEQVAELRRLPRIIQEELDHDAGDLQDRLPVQLPTLLPSQRAIFDRVLAAVDEHRPLAVFVDVAGGSGKTYLFNALLAAVRSRGMVALAVAYSDHNERWGEPAPAAGDVELLNKQLRFQAYRQYALWWSYRRTAVPSHRGLVQWNMDRLITAAGQDIHHEVRCYDGRKQAAMNDLALRVFGIDLAQEKPLRYTEHHPKLPSFSGLGNDYRRGMTSEPRRLRSGVVMAESGAGSEPDAAAVDVNRLVDAVVARLTATGIGMAAAAAVVKEEEPEVVEDVTTSPSRTQQQLWLAELHRQLAVPAATFGTRER